MSNQATKKRTKSESSPKKNSGKSKIVHTPVFPEMSEKKKILSGKKKSYYHNT